MADIDKNSPEYLAGRRDLANELAAEKEAEKRLSLADIKSMDSAAINSRWSEVQAVLGGKA